MNAGIVALVASVVGGVGSVIAASLSRRYQRRLHRIDLDGVEIERVSAAAASGEALRLAIHRGVSETVVAATQPAPASPQG